MLWSIVTPFFLKRGKSVAKTSDLGKGRGKPGSSCDRAVGVLGAVLAGAVLILHPRWVCSRGVVLMVASCCHPNSSDGQQ